MVPRGTRGSPAAEVQQFFGRRDETPTLAEGAQRTLHKISVKLVVVRKPALARADETDPRPPRRSWGEGRCRNNLGAAAATSKAPLAYHL